MRPFNAPPPAPRLRVCWRSGLVTNFELQAVGIRGYVGVRADHEGGEVDPRTLRPVGQLAQHDEVEDLPIRREYLMALAEGHLWACDQETAERAARHAGRPAEWREFLAPDLGNRRDDEPTSKPSRAKTPAAEPEKG